MKSVSAVFKALACITSAWDAHGVVVKNHPQSFGYPAERREKKVLQKRSFLGDFETQYDWCNQLGNFKAEVRTVNKILSLPNECAFKTKP